jgi:FKBP-type peptidyl-prolyl cis-trans isomerase
MKNFILLLTCSIGLSLSSCLSPEDQAVVDDPSIRLDEEQAAIDQYLSENNITVQIDSILGIRYFLEDFQDSLGIKATSFGDQVLVNYKLRILGDTAIYEQNDSITFALNQVIPGWTYGLHYAREGQRIHLFLPSTYAYGAQGTPGNRSTGRPGIPPYTNLYFEVELLDVVLVNPTQVTEF